MQTSAGKLKSDQFSTTLTVTDVTYSLAIAFSSHFLNNMEGYFSELEVQFFFTMERKKTRPRLKTKLCFWIFACDQKRTANKKGRGHDFRLGQDKRKLRQEIPLVSPTYKQDHWRGNKRARRKADYPFGSCHISG